jgi:hypothetical protein
VVRENVDGSALPAEQRYPQQDFVRRWRPWEISDHKGTLLIQNLRIHDAINQRAMDVAVTSMDRPTPSAGEALTFAKVIIRNCETADIGRDEVGRRQGVHVDHIRISGAGSEQPVETEVLLEDVYIHGGDALPLLIGEGKFGRITLRRVRIENTHGGGAQITAIVGGAVGEVIVEDSPGLKLSLIGRPGSIKRCMVKNSPGAVVSDTSTAVGKSGAVILSGEEAESEMAKIGGEKVAATRPAGVARVVAAAKLEVVADQDGKTLHAALVGEMGEDVEFVTFEAADRFEYLMGAPVVVMERPWKADLRPGRRGEMTVRATITRNGGDPDKAIVGKVQMP